MHRGDATNHDAIDEARAGGIDTDGGHVPRSRRRSPARHDEIPPVNRPSGDAVGLDDNYIFHDVLGGHDEHVRGLARAVGIGGKRAR